MSTEAVTLFFALLAVATQLFLFASLILATSAKWRAELVRSIGPIALVGAAVIAAVAMLGSLYLSEVAHFVPCKLCWYQRIAMYPSAVLLVAAVARHDAGVGRHVKILAAIGAVISSYHLLIERFPDLESSVCELNNPCSNIWVERFGYVTIPVMALSAFVAVFCLLVVHGRHHHLSFQRSGE